MGSGRRILASGLGIGLTILAGADVARAGEVSTFGGYKYVLVERLSEPGATKTVSAKCPGNTHVLGGGGESGGGFGDTFISSSFPFDGGDPDSRPDDGWKVTHSSFDDFREIYATAVCARLMPTYRKQEFEVTSEAALEVAVPCGNERNILHGGLRGSPAVQPVASYPHDGGVTNDAWRLSVHNVAGKTRSFIAHAICSDELPVIYVSTAHEADPLAQDYGDASCPVNAPNAIGGGPVISPPFGSFHWSSNSPDLSASPPEWYVGVEFEFGGNAIPYTIWADCVADVGSFP